MAPSTASPTRRARRRRRHDPGRRRHLPCRDADARDAPPGARRHGRACPAHIRHHPRQSRFPPRRGAVGGDAARPAGQRAFSPCSPSPSCSNPALAVLPAPCTARRPGRDLTAWMDSGRDARGNPAPRPGAWPGKELFRGWFRPRRHRAGPRAAGRPRLSGARRLARPHRHRRADLVQRHARARQLQARRAGRGARRDARGAGRPAGRLAGRDERLRLALRPARAPAGRGPGEFLAAALPPVAARRQTLLRLLAQGRTRLGGRIALEAALEASAPDFAHVVSGFDGLVSLCESDDLDLIDKGGALRQAAEALVAEGDDPARPESERAVAREALARLFAYARTGMP